MKWEPRHHISVQDDNLDREDLFNCLRPGQKQGLNTQGILNTWTIMSGHCVANSLTIRRISTICKSFLGWVEWTIVQSIKIHRFVQKDFLLGTPETSLRGLRTLMALRVLRSTPSSGLPALVWVALAMGLSWGLRIVMYLNQFMNGRDWGKGNGRRGKGEEHILYIERIFGHERIFWYTASTTGTCCVQSLQT